MDDCNQWDEIIGGVTNEEAGARWDEMVIDDKPGSKPCNNLAPLLNPTLFIRSDGTSMEFALYPNGEPDQHGVNVMDNCAFLMQLCGATIMKIKWKRVHSLRKVSGNRICLVFNEAECYNYDHFQENMLEVRNNLQCEMYSSNFAWHSILSKSLMNLDKYLVCAEPICARRYFDSSAWLRSRPRNWSDIRDDIADDDAYGILGAFLSYSDSDNVELVEEVDVSNLSLELPKVFLDARHSGAEFVLLAIDEWPSKIDAPDFTALKAGLSFLIQLTGGRLLDSGGTVKQLNEYEVPILVGGWIMGFGLKPEIEELQGKLRCDIISDDFIIHEIFSQVSLRKAYADPSTVDLAARTYNKEKDTFMHFQGNFWIFMKKPHIIPDAQVKGAKVLMGKTTWSYFREQAAKKDLHTESCSKKENLCIVCMPGAKAAVPSSSSSVNYPCTPSVTKKKRDYKTEAWLDLPECEYLDKLRTEMIEASEKEIAIKHVKIYQARTVSGVEAKIRNLNRDNNTAVGAMVKKVQKTKARKKGSGGSGNL